jgi:uncharacterized membrane protein
MTGTPPIVHCSTTIEAACAAKDNTLVFSNLNIFIVLKVILKYQMTGKQAN